MTNITIADIKTIDIFNIVDEATAQKLIEIAKVLKLKKGDILFSEKENVSNIFAVLCGKMTMFRYTEEGQKRVVFILDSGEILNEVIFDSKPASISCEAFEESTILSFNRKDLLSIMEGDFLLTKNVIDSMAHKIRRLYRQLKNTVPIKMEKRVAAKLWKLSKDYGVDTPDGVMIDLNLTVTYLADMLGSSRETISRTLKNIENMKFIEYKNKKIIVKSRENLAKFFKSM